MLKRIILCGLIIMGMLLAVRFTVVSAAGQAPISFIANDVALEAAFYQQLLARNTDFQFSWAGDAEDIVDGDWLTDVFTQVYERDQATSDDFDYLLYSVKDYELVSDISGNAKLFNLRVSYRESPQQLAKVNLIVNKSLASLKLLNDSPAVQVRKIHDFIIRKVKFDGATHKDSAYTAITTGQSNSRGYALLAYKMLTEAGVPCRIVRGTVAGEAAVWNMVQIDGMWYYIDLARDDGDNEVVPVRYNYFLRGSTAMIKDHNLVEDYQMAEFEANHPVDIMDYPGRDKLILQADAAALRDKVGVGPFNELYSKVSAGTVDPFEKFNDAITNGALSALQDVFAGI